MTRYGARWGGLFLLACMSPEVEMPQPEHPAPVPQVAPQVRHSLPNVSYRLPEREVRSSAAVSLSDEVLSAREILDRVVRAHTRDPDNPWAIGHALIALGPDISLTNQEPAIPWLFREYGETVQIGDDVAIRFPTRRGEIRVEPHSDLLLKALTEVGFAPNTPVHVNGSDLSGAHLYGHSLWRTWVDGERLSVSSWNDLAWTVQGLAAWAPEDLRWTANNGLEMDLDGLTTAIVGRLETETAFLTDAVARGTEVQKRGQGIFAYTCGGAHLLQGAAYAVARGFGVEGDRARIEAQVPVQYYRLEFEVSLVDRLLQEHPEYGVPLIEQRLKFLGHFLESIHKLVALGFHEPTDAEREGLASALTELVRTVTFLESHGIFGDLEQIRVADEQRYLDFIGDSAHALVGLDLATGARGVRY